MLQGRFRIQNYFDRQFLTMFLFLRNALKTVEIQLRQVQDSAHEEKNHLHMYRIGNS